MNNEQFNKEVALAEERRQLEARLAFGMNGITEKDVPIKQKIEQYLKDKNVFLERGKDYDVVSKPKHYMLFDEMEVKERAFEGQGIEVRDVIEKLVGKIQLEGPAWGGHSGMFISDYVQMMQYLMRFMEKNGKEDLEKAKFYLDKMIESY